MFLVDNEKLLEAHLRIEMEDDGEVENLPLMVLLHGGSIAEKSVTLQKMTHSTRN